MPTTLRPSVLFLFAFAALFVAVALSPIPHSAAAEEAADDYLFSLELVVETPLDPVGLAHAGDDRLFVVERRGFIRIIEEGELFEDPFLDISDQVVTSNWEQGLLGLVFHPDYDQNGYFYVNYTGVDGDTRVSRFQVSAGDPNQADPDSEQVILLVAQPEADHNGGTMVFGPDGYLYVALGDGGLINNYPNAQK
ncbi:MAG TPA: PQQ-dependent sugar dehydrogenase, partial [Candidatus Sulfomarinibacteraceae bacterium]|nr:PQQ-dependent sugar dehydrogenase [Candidatus Sulfomarinibacteraceae bacterium]